MSPSDQIKDNPARDRKLITLVVLGSIILLSLLCICYFSNQQNPLSAPPDGLGKDPLAMAKLKEMIGSYKERIEAARLTGRLCIVEHGGPVM